MHNCYCEILLRCAPCITVGYFSGRANEYTAQTNMSYFGGRRVFAYEDGKLMVYGENLIDAMLTLQPVGPMGVQYVAVPPQQAMMAYPPAQVYTQQPPVVPVQAYYAQPAAAPKPGDVEAPPPPYAAAVPVDGQKNQM